MIYHTEHDISYLFLCLLYIYCMSIVFSMPRRYFSKKEGVWKIHTTISLREDVFTRLENYARTYYNGNISSALEFIVDTFFKVINIAAPPTKIVIETSTTVKEGNNNNGEERKEGRKRRNSGDDKVDALESELLSIDAESKLQHYLEIMEGMEKLLREFMASRKLGLSVDYPNIQEMRKTIDKIAKDVSKILVDKRVPKTPVILELIDKCQRKMREVKELIVEVLRR